MTIPRRIDQFTPALAPGDGVTRGVFLTQRFLRAMGYASDIVARHVTPDLADRARPVADYAPAAGTTLLYHHSIGHEDHDRLMALPVARVMVYHNITPAHFFRTQPFLAEACAWGRAQLADAAPRVVAAYADSAYNRRELEALGYRRPEVLPLLVAFPPEDPPALKPHRSGTPFSLLSVGRLVSNKCQHQVIEAAWILRKTLGLDVRLTLVGGVSQEDYARYLYGLPAFLGISDAVTFAGKVSDADLAAQYRAADLFLSVSDHEGFCIPLLEAVRAGVPVLAHAAGGVPDTLSGHGLLHRKAPSAVAEAVAGLIHDPRARSTLWREQWAATDRFAPARLKAALESFLRRHGLAAF